MLGPVRRRRQQQYILHSRLFASCYVAARVMLSCAAACWLPVIRRVWEPCLKRTPACPWQVVEFVKSQEYARFTRIVFDTAPTGHTLRLLTVPDFVESSLNKLIRLRKKLGAAGSAVRGLFGAAEKQDAAVAKLEGLRVGPPHPL